MGEKQPKRVEDYTTAVLCMVLVNLLWIFVALWSWIGIIPVILLALLIYQGIEVLSRHIE